MNDVRALLGNTDLYLIDLWMKGRLEGLRSVLDAGAGRGRNLHPFAGLRRVAVDLDAAALAELPEDVECLVGAIEELALPGRFDLVVCCALLHFARDAQHFSRMLRACWEAVEVEGLLFVRTASRIGLEPGREFTVGDGAEPFLLAAVDFFRWTEELGGVWEEPLRTSVVEGGRCMTTWVLRKPALPIFAP